MNPADVLPTLLNRLAAAEGSAATSIWRFMP